MRILIIEDDTFLSDLYKNQLEKANHTVFQTFDPSEGIKDITQNDPDLVLLDLIMPKFSGMEILKKLKSDDKIKKTPVVVLSNIKDEKIIQQATDLGAKGYIIKASITPDQIAQEIKKYL